jgi:Mitochondrial branched-chain alpha-ketoacid dehydrogenase kinase
MRQRPRFFANGAARSFRISSAPLSVISSSVVGGYNASQKQNHHQQINHPSRSSLSTSASTSASPFSEGDLAMIDDAAHQVQTSVSLQALMQTGRGEFLYRTFGEELVERHAATDLVLMLRRELPIRMAHRVADLEKIPVLREMKSVQSVKAAYIQSCLEIMAFDKHIDNMQKEEEFARVIENIYERHASVLVQMARGAYEFRQAVRKQDGNSDFELEEETHAFLDRFYLCRIGIRVLIGQYLALRQPPVENYVGIICSMTSPYEIVKRAIDDAAFMCTRKYGDAPEVIMSGRLDLTFPYVPTHLRMFSLPLVTYGFSMVHPCVIVHFWTNLRKNVFMFLHLLLPFWICFFQNRLHYAGTPEEQHASYG